jgi:hypothetical protein
MGKEEPLQTEQRRELFEDADIQLNAGMRLSLTVKRDDAKPQTARFEVFADESHRDAADSFMNAFRSYMSADSFKYRFNPSGAQSSALISEEIAIGHRSLEQVAEEFSGSSVAIWNHLFYGNPMPSTPPTARAHE